MASIMSYFGGRADPKQSAREAIVTLRQQLQMIEKKEEHLQKKIDQELAKAKANAVSNKTVATAALKRKKASEGELDRMAGTRLQLEMQVNTLESANLNAETMAAMKKGAGALKAIHGKTTLEVLENTMAEVNEQRELANEIAESISNPMGDLGYDDEELKEELAELEQEKLNDQLMGDHAPVHLPPGVTKEQDRQKAVEADEEAELRELQASLAM